MQETVIDGVPVIWEQGPEPLTAALVFGSGVRHETFRTVPVTHLIEHIVMASLPKSALDRNAQVELGSTTFHATGRADAVVGFLRQVCAALSDLPLDHLEREARVVGIEQGTAEHPAIAAALTSRYGFVAQGLVSAAGPGAEQITAEQVRAHAAQHFNAANAVLVLTGPPPKDLRLPLPAGERPPLPVAPPLELGLPGHASRELDLVSLSGLLDAPQGALPSVLLTVLVERLTDELRGRRGIAYDVDGGLTWVSPGQAMLTVWSDGREEELGTIGTVMWDTLRAIADEGPGGVELAHAKDVVADRLHDPRGTVDWLITQATRILRDLPMLTRRDFAAEQMAVSSEQLAAAAAGMCRSALVLRPEEAGDIVGLRSLDEDEYPDGPPLADATTYRRKTISTAPRDLAVSVGAEGLSVYVYGGRASATWSDVVGVAAAPGLRDVILADGRVFTIIGKHLRDSESLIRRIDEHAHDRLFEGSADEILR
ncbi:insulinase family protein [Tessaracoccus oleiagri]|uniref:insulinase family protein n=1 Tax=Tessaracoccus oleiagri TaxID=686624 RepID=UPI00115FCCE4|nr:insulinase family protein [Tessaracoccus oleiagri]